MIINVETLQAVKDGLKDGKSLAQLVKLVPEGTPGQRMKRLKNLVLDLYNAGELSPSETIIPTMQKDYEGTSFEDYVLQYNKVLGIETKAARKKKPSSRKGRKEIVVISDLHGPDVRVDLLAKIAVQHAGATLVIAGDFWNLNKASKFIKKTRPQYASREMEMTVREAMKSTVAAFATVAPAFDEIFFVKGNHDERLANVLGMNCDSGAAMADDLMQLYLSPIENLHFTGQDYIRDFFMFKIGDAWMGHWDCCGKPINAGASKSIEWMLSNPEVQAAGEWNVLVHGHTHKVSEGVYLGKRGMECGCLTTNPDYYWENPGKFSYIQLGYAKLVQYDGITDDEESGLVRFNRKYLFEEA